MLKDFFLILRPPYLSLKHFLSSSKKNNKIKLIVISGIIILLWLLMFWFSVKVLKNFKAAEDLGIILCLKLMGIIWLSGSVLLIFSSIISSLSNFYLSKDLSLLIASPLTLEQIFWGRSAQSQLNSSWMPIAFILPVLLAYAYVFKASYLFFLLLAACGLPLVLIVGYFSQLIVIATVRLLPAKQTKNIVGFLALLGFTGLYILFRLLKPESLVDPETFINTATYLANLEKPLFPYLPSTWVTEILWPYLYEQKFSSQELLKLCLLWSSAITSGIFTSWVFNLFYWTGYNKNLEGLSRPIPTKSIYNYFFYIIGLIFKGQNKALIIKDIKVFFRDHTQWTQILLLAALMIIYIYNFSVLNIRDFPLYAFQLENIIAFFNIALVALVSAMLALRFAFPSISAEGFAYWIIRSSPISYKEFIRIKYWFWFIPIMVVALSLIIVTNYFLNNNIYLNIVSIFATLILTPAICALATGLGAVYPKFETENLGQVSTGYGGFIFMLFSSLFTLIIILLIIWPVVLYMKVVYGMLDKVPDWKWYLSCFLLFLSALISYFTAKISLKKGLNALIAKDNE